MNKRGASQTFWILLIAVLTIIGLLFTATLFGKTKELSENLADYEICKNGNFGVVKTRLKVFDWVIAEQGVKHCRTEKVTVPSGKEYEAIAKKMALCWDEYLQGKEEVFQTQDANYCAFCSVLEFEDKNKKLNELSKYLASNKPQLSEENYLKYLSQVDSTGDKIMSLENLELNNLDIDTSKKLAVMFVMYEDKYPGTILNQPRILTASEGVAGGTVIGASLMGLSYVGGLALCSTFVGCSAGAFLMAGAGGMSGFLIGSDRSADWSAKILVTEYDKQKLEQLKCTQLEGLDYLKIQKK